MKNISALLFAVFLTYSNLGHAHSPVGFVIPKDGAIIKQAPQTIEIVFTAPAKLIKLEFSRVISNGKSSLIGGCLLYTSPSPRDRQKSRMPSSA